MIRISSLWSIRLHRAVAGQFFMPRDQSGQRFLVGTVNNQWPVGLDLEGQPFFFSDLPVLDGRRGFTVSDFEIMVDQQSSMPARGVEADKVPLGSIILNEGNVSILGIGRNNLKAFVSIRGETIPEDADAVAFTKWAIVAKDEKDQWKPLFEYGDAGEWVKSLIA